MNVFYNDNDHFVAAWLCSLIAAGHLPLGEVAKLSVADLQPEDLRGFDQCHFFAGIGGWPLALKWAEWPNDRPVWTGSCPCQPLSGAGQRKGHADERHLWPAFYRLIAECRPPTIFGEQVASKDGREWLAGVRADLEDLGYAVGAADLCAASVGAPHIRQRLFWLADSNSKRWQTSNVQVICNPKSQKLPLIISTSWGDCDVVERDGQRRRIKRGISIVAHGLSERLEQIRAYGNAIVPQTAAEFIQAVMETE